MAHITLGQYGHHTTQAQAKWQQDFANILVRYISGEPIYVGFNPTYEPRRKGSVGRLVINNVQDYLHGGPVNPYYRHMEERETLPEIPENVKTENMARPYMDGHIVWEGRSNKVKINHFHQYIIDDHQGGTNWVYEKPVVEQEPANDRLGREIKIGDFISYVLYHFDNGYNGAGIYYGKVTKIDLDGTVYAKNIKLAPDDAVAEKRIKDNSLIVLMTKDLMDQLMLAKLSSL